MKKLTKKEKEILGNYEALRGIKENTILSGGIAKKRKASLDDYDNMSLVDNSTNDVDFGLDNYDNLESEEQYVRRNERDIFNNNQPID